MAAAHASFLRSLRHRAVAPLRKRYSSERYCCSSTCGGLWRVQVSELAPLGETAWCLTLRSSRRARLRRAFPQRAARVSARLSLIVRAHDVKRGVIGLLAFLAVAFWPAYVYYFLHEPAEASAEA